jgi:starch-binding outer membrane protein, SusD/RagB family
MKTKINRVSAIVLSALVLLSIESCSKFLDKKPDQKLAVPATLKDFQAILDYYSRVNQFSPGAGEASADNYYLATTDYNAMSAETERRLYTWQNDFVLKTFPNDWSYSWDNIFKANTVLDNINTVPRTATNAGDWDNTKGQAFVLRAKCMLQIASVWCKAYDSATSSVDLGLPLRINSDFNLPSVRASLEDTYKRIVSDLTEAVPLLPNTPLHVMRFAKPAAFALLARTYLSMRQYEKAGRYADSCLQLYNTLLDYNAISTTASFPFARFNAEVIWESFCFLHEQLFSSNAKVDSVLYTSYAVNDVRRTLFFKSNNNGTYAFKGSYEGGDNLFDGIATDEIYLIRAECKARTGDKVAAMSDLNTLLAKRYKAGTFLPLTAADATAALSTILAERRKELFFRCLRWMDIKRLNKEGANITLQRNINGQLYTLAPNDPRYALPIPEDIISLSGMQQNPR